MSLEFSSSAKARRTPWTCSENLCQNDYRIPIIISFSRSWLENEKSLMEKGEISLRVCTKRGAWSLENKYILWQAGIVMRLTKYGWTVAQFRCSTNAGPRRDYLGNSFRTRFLTPELVNGFPLGAFRGDEAEDRNLHAVPGRPSRSF